MRAGLLGVPKPDREHSQWQFGNSIPLVEPRKATDQKDITRPLICGELTNCKVLLPSEEKLIEQIPTSTKASPESRRLGIKEAANTASPNNNEALTSL